MEIGRCKKLKRFILSNDEDMRAIEGLLKSTESLDLAQEVGNMGSWYFDLNDNKLYWSKQTFRIFKTDKAPHTHDEYIATFIHTEDVPQYLNQFQDFCLKIRPFNMNYRIVLTGGDIRYVQVKARFLVDSLGEPIKLIGTIQDLTESRELEIQDQQYKSLFDFNPDMIYSFDLDGNFTDCNYALSNLTGYSKEELLSKPFLDLIYEPHKNEAIFRFREAKNGSTQRYNITAITKKGDLMELSAMKFPIIIDGTVVGVYGIAKDITEENRAKTLMIEAESKFRHLVEDSVAGAFIVQDELMIYANPEAKKILGNSNLEGRSIWEVIHPGDVEFVHEKLSKPSMNGQAQNFVAKFIKDDRTTIDLEIHGTRTQINGKVSYIGTFVDITEKKLIADQNAYLAYHDHLTSLSNLRSLEDKLDKLIVLSKVLNLNFAVLYLDLDRFKYINDSLGHHIGDLLLKNVAERLKDLIQPTDFIARIAGDEFILLIHNIPPAAAVETGKLIIENLEKPFNVSEYEINITASIGISVYPEDGDDRITLLRKADGALYRAKSVGKNNVQIYTPTINIDTYKLYSLEKDLRKAIENNELELYYQPKVNKKGNILGAEALIRWNHPEWGLIPPDEFLPLAEQTGFIKRIEQWVPETVCKQMKFWHQNGFLKIPISVNVSAIRFMDTDFIENIQRSILASELEPHWLEIEITETSLLQNEQVVSESLDRLKEIGVQISLDDFGQGYSSLSYLKRFKNKIDTLKVDRQFIQDITSSSEDALIAQTIIQLAHQMKLKVVAEGVETREQLAVLSKFNCDQIQGYLFSKPLPIAVFEGLLNKGNIEISDTGENHNEVINRREYFRIPFPYPLSAMMTITLFKGKNMNLGHTEVLIEDMGPGGLRFLSNIRLTTSDDIILQFQAEIMEEIIIVNGIVVWVKEIKDKIYQYGLRFMITEGERQALSVILNKLSLQLRHHPTVKGCHTITADRYKYLKSGTTKGN